MPNFFSNGCIIAHFISEGKIPVVNDILTISLTLGAKTGNISCSRNVGMGFRRQVSLERFTMMKIISEAVVGVKLLHCDENGVISDLKNEIESCL